VVEVPHQGQSLVPVEQLVVELVARENARYLPGRMFRKIL
jgi:hypothetical protein